jgi:hypothetical protein
MTEEKPLPFFYIMGFDGKKLVLEKANGTTWDYPLRESDFKRALPVWKVELLNEAQKEKCKILGIAEMKPISAKVLILERILI